jgi:hypothetical protein
MSITYSSFQLGIDTGGGGQVVKYYGAVKVQGCRKCP